MGFGRKARGLVSSWVSTSKVEKENDPVFAQKAHELDVLEKTLQGLQESMKIYLYSWQSMCQASAAIAEGLAKLAGKGEMQKASPLQDMARVYHSAHRSIDAVIREPTHRVAEDMALRQTGALLHRFPPIHRKIARRRQLLAEFTLAASKLRTAEAASQRDKSRDVTGAAAESRRRLATSLETVASVANGVTQEVMAEIDRLESERGTMLVPQVSALVGCQAYFFRRSAAILERLTTPLPYSALALCRLVQPSSTTEPVTAVSARSSLSLGGGSVATTVSPSPLHPSSHSFSSASSISVSNPFVGEVAMSSPPAWSDSFVHRGDDKNARSISTSGTLVMGGGSGSYPSSGSEPARHLLPPSASAPARSVCKDGSNSSRPPPPPPPPSEGAPTFAGATTATTRVSRTLIEGVTDENTGPLLAASPTLGQNDAIFPSWAVDGVDDDDVVVEEVVW